MDIFYVRCDSCGNHWKITANQLPTKCGYCFGKLHAEGVMMNVQPEIVREQLAGPKTCLAMAVCAIPGCCIIIGVIIWVL